MAQAALCEVVSQLFPGAAITACASVRAALAALDTAVFDLALVDLSLPDGSGLAVVRRCQASSPPVTAVVVTIYDDDDHLFPALQAGAAGYVIKDSSPELLLTQLQRIKDGEPPLSPAIARRILAGFQQSSGATTEVPAPAVVPAPEAQIDATDAVLTPRESEVLLRVAKGYTNPEIAKALGVSRFTVSGHVKEVYRKLSVSSRAEAALAARRIGLV